ncbi:cytochrome P450 [Staphylotrichum tortipilum]|uniref:Cytochrome P450 n=1 Tax=Staphylotrichum tortipilum TaxID=2831512 RepID=A0AAN6MAX3_9PEZI|nr:cytochrome P450 [Staphylotrichum longicolle]
MSLLELWRLKVGLSSGKPFDVAEDANEFAFDAILNAALGLGPDGGDVKRQIQHLTTNQARAVSHKEAIVVFSRANKSPKLSALQVEEDSLWKAFLMPWPRLYHTINHLRPSVRRARRTMQAHIATQITKNLHAPGKEPECALDYVMQRELRAAEKAGRAPVLNDPRIVNPVYGYLIAGHDTSSGTLLWLIRRLTAHPEYQSRVRACLRSTYSDAWTEKRLPTAAELARQHSPWLDATLEETLRLDSPVVNILVVAKTNTTVLGHFLPKDTPVFLNLTGASLNRPSVPVDDALRRASSSAHPAQRENWDGEDPDVFKPERWLKHEDSGRLLFDGSAGPALAFSAGNRGCFGKRLGLLKLRIAAALLVWSFEFEKVPSELVSSETYESLVTAPKECLVRLKEATA